MTPLCKFHGHIIKTFSALPPNRKCLEVAKRIALVIVSPLAYLVLGLIGLLGYPCTTKVTKTAPIQNLESDWTNPSSTADGRSSSIVKSAKQEMLQSVECILEAHKNVSKIKYLINCELADHNRSFEIDIFPKEGSMDISHFRNSIDEPLEKVKNWFIEKFGIHGLEGEIRISGQAFCLTNDNILHASWSAKDHSTQNSTAFQASVSMAFPDKEHLVEYLKLCFDRLNMEIPENFKPGDLFERKLLANQ